MNSPLVKMDNSTAFYFNEDHDYDDRTSSSSSPSINVFFVTFLPLLCLLTVLANLATLIAFLKERSLREKPSDLFILSLSIADLCDGAFTIPFLTLLYVLGYWPLGELGCKALVAASDVFIFESILMVMCISIDRLLLVSLSYSTYVKLQSRFRVRATIAVCWIIGLVPMVIELSLWDIAKRVEPSAALIDYNVYCLSPPRRIEMFSLLFFVGFVVLPVVVIAGLSLAFILFLHRKLRKRRRIGNGEPSAAASTVNGNVDGTSMNGDGSRGATAARSSTKNRYLKPAITLGVLVLSMLVCMIPYCVYVIFIELYCPRCINPSILLGLVVLTHVNSLLDPLVYSVTQTKIRNYYKSKIRRLFQIVNGL